MSTSDMEVDTKALSIDESPSAESSQHNTENVNASENGNTEDTKIGDTLSPSDAESMETSSDDKTDDKEKDDDSSDTTSVDSSSSLTTALTKAHQLKEEGNGYFKENKLNLAARSYRKATTSLKKLVTQSSDPQLHALSLTLYTNHSMVCFKQTKWKQSKEMATMALNLDGNHVKALYRRAVAAQKMGDLEVAKADLKKALKVDPENKEIRRGWVALKKDLDKMNKKEKEAKEKLKKAMSKGGSFLYEDKEEEMKQKALEKEKEKQRKEKLEQDRKKQWEDECVQKLANDEQVVPYDEWKKDLIKKEEEEAKRKKEEEEKVKKEREEERRKRREQARKEESSDDDDELTEEEKKMFRGYKKTSDGRTTSYFTREISDNEKKLIGNIAPQKLDASNDTGPKPIAASNNGKTQSAWNAAQTWEERDTTDWCTSALEKRLNETTAIMQPFSATITKVKLPSGHASFVLSSGKKRYVFDYTAELEFKVHDEDDEKVASGTLNLIDMCSATARSGEYEVELKWKKSPKGEHAGKVTSLCKDDLIQAAKASVMNFVEDFNAHY